MSKGLNSSDQTGRKRTLGIKKAVLDVMKSMVCKSKTMNKVQNGSRDVLQRLESERVGPAFTLIDPISFCRKVLTDLLTAPMLPLCRAKFPRRICAPKFVAGLFSNKSVENEFDSSFPVVTLVIKRSHTFKQKLCVRKDMFLI